MRSSASEPWESFHLRSIPASPRLKAVAQAPEVASPAQNRHLLPINPKPKRIPEHLRSQVLNLPKDTATSHLVQGQGLIDQEPPKLKRPEPDQKSVQTSQQDFEVIPELLQRRDVMTVPDLLMQSQLHLQAADGKLGSTNRLTADGRGIVRDPGIAHLNRVVSRECSPPDQFLSLTHWRVLLEILSRLSPAERENFRKYEVQMTFGGLPIGPSPIQDYGSMDFVDTNAHLDKLIKNKKVSSLDELEGIMHCRNLHLSTVVANYVYPNLWQKAQEHQRHDMCERIAYTFGIHPHFVKEQNPLERLKELLRDERCVGLGEVGLDYSGNCRQHPNSQCDCTQNFHDQQKKFLREVLPWAKELNKTLVIHCRGRQKEDGSAASDVLAILQELGLAKLRIHRHCFLGTKDELKEWLRVCPNAMFGVTAKEMDASDHRRVVQHIPLEKLLIESDAPYLAPPQHQVLNNSP